MKYVFAAVLVVLAIVLVFHGERFLPLPHAFGRVMSSTLSPHIPFSFKTAYAESCIAGLEAKQGRVQYAVSESAVRLKELDRQMDSWRGQLGNSVARLRGLVNQSADISADAIGREVQRHDSLQWKITQTLALRSRLEDTMKSLEQAEGDASQKVVELRNRLEIVSLDHERNNAQDLASEMHNESLSSHRTWTSLGAETIRALEHQERTREEWHRRYGLEAAAETGEPKVDRLARAKEILAQVD